MKTNHLLISLVLLMFLACSCSRQVTSLESTSQFKTASLLTSKQESVPSKAILSQIQVETPKDIAINPKVYTHTYAGARQISDIKREPQFHKIIKKTTETVVAVALMQPGNLSFLQKHTADRGYPQINKAGFIFVAAGILGFFLKLLPVACWICIGIGLIVLLSPLLRKRY